MGKAFAIIEKITEMEVSEYVPMSEKDLDAEIEKELKGITEQDISEAMKEEDISEAKSTFPGADKLKKLHAMAKKGRDIVKSKEKLMMHLRNDWQAAKDKKDRKGQIAITKKKKALQAEITKQMDVNRRVGDLKKKLLDDRKAFNKKKRAAKKADSKKAA